MGEISRYVVAFNRDRDFYQVPAALAEHGKLEALVTDLYVPDCFAGGRIPRMLGLSHRHSDLVSSKLVRSSLNAVWLQLGALRFAKSEGNRSEVFHHIDSHLSRLAAREAGGTNAGLFLYSGYALEAFAELRDSSVPRLLFVYHPQGDYVRQVLEEDCELHPEVAVSHHWHLEEIALNEGQRVSEEVNLATGIACASSFTADSVRACLEGDPKRVAVVPYGCPSGCGIVPSGEKADMKRPQVLFVGQGTQRKGLHHLIKVWQHSLHQIADLTLVVSRMDPGIMRLIESLPTEPRLLKGLSRSDLSMEFQRADVFVMPSLVEGFGLVYLEALAAGCHVIGTRNTGLPDLYPPIEAATVVAAGDSGALLGALELAINSVKRNEYDRNNIRAFAATCTWERFRAGIRGFIEAIEQGKKVEK